MHRGISKIVLLSLIFTQLSSYAQNTEREISFGFQAGYVNTTLYGSFVDHIKSHPVYDPVVVEKVAFEISATVSYQVYKSIFTTSGIGFIQKGGSIENSGSLYPVDVTLNYLTIPVSIGIKPIKLDKFSILVSAGLINNIELSSSRDFTKGTSGDDSNNKYTLSLSMGGSVNYRINNIISLQGDVFFINDLLPFYEWDISGEHYEMKTKGKVFSLGVVYKWR